MNLNRKFILPLAVCVLMHLFFCKIATERGHNTNKDSEEYLSQAFNIRHHHTFYCGRLDGEPPYEALYSQRPPGYGFFLLITNACMNRHIPILIQYLLGILTFILVLKCISKIYPDVRTWIITIPFLFIWSSYIFAGMIMAETLFTFFITSAAAVLILSSNKYSYYTAAILLTLAMLVKPIVWLIPIVLLLAGIVYCRRYKVRFKILLPLTLPLIVITMMLVRNYNLTGVVEYSSISRKLLLNYNLPALLTSVQGNEAAHSEMEVIQHHAGLVDYKNRTKFIDNEITKYILKYPLQYILLHVKGTAEFFLDTGRWDINYFFNGEGVPKNWQSMSESGSLKSYFAQYHPVQIIWFGLTLLFNIMVFVAFIAFMFNRNIRAQTRFVIAFTVLWFAILTGPSASARFRVPVVPVLLIAWPALFMSRSNKKPVKPSAVTFAE